MRRLQLLFLVLMCLLVQHAFAETITKPEAGKTYMIQHSSNLYLTMDGGQLKIMLPGTGDSQKFEFVPVEGSDVLYNIKLPTGEFIGSDKGYSVVFLTDAADPYAQFSFPVSYEPEFVNLKNEGRGACLGSDNNNDGGGVYTDKSGMDGKHLWKIVEATGGVIVIALQDAIDKAQGILEGAPIGTEPGKYPQSAADALQAAIDEAKEALSATEQEAVNKAVTLLNASIEIFNMSQNIVNIDPEKQYYLIHYPSNLVLATNSSTVIIQNPAGADNQKFRLIEVEGIKNLYNLQLSDGTSYIIRNGWRIQIGTDPSVDNARFVMELVDGDAGIIRFKEYQTGPGYLGTDGLTDDSGVYGNKGNAEKSWWLLQEVVEGELITIGLDNTIIKAEQFLAKAVIGDKLGNYPQKAVDALTTAIQAARDAKAAAAVQEDINSAMTTLNNAISTFQSSEIFLMAGYKYRIQGRKRGGFFDVVEGTAGQVANMTSGNVGEHFEFVQNEDGSFCLKNDGLNVGADYVMTASEIKWVIRYEATVNNIKYYNILQADDLTKCMGDNSGKSWNIQTLSANNDALQFRFVRVDAANDPNRVALEAAIGLARNTLANADRGNEIGQWNDKKCDAFEAVIVKGETLDNATQEEVDAVVAELQQAEKDFKNNPNAVIKDELEALFVTAREKVSTAIVGIEAGEFFQTTIEKMETRIAEYEKKGNEVSEQDECDALTAEFKAIVDAFKGHIEKQTVKDVLADAIQSAESLYESQKENVGTDKGQRPQEVIDAFETAIDKAKAIVEPVIEDLNTLQEARRSFIDGTISVDRKALRTAIAAAGADEFKNLVAGAFDGQYPQEKIDAFNAALTAADEANTDLSKVQAEVDACTKALNDAMKALQGSKVVISFTELDASLAIAEPAVASVTVIGDGDGQCPQSVIDALQSVIDETKAINRKAIAQTDVNALAEKLDGAIATFKTALIASTGLQVLIDKAQAQLDASVEGFKPGNYPVTARSQFRKSIGETQAVIDAEEVSQAGLLAAVETLKAAIAKFESAVIAANDLTELNTAISEVDAFVVQHGDGFTTLNLALSKAKAVVGNPDNYTKSEVTKILEELRKALKAAQSSVGIRDTRLASLVVYDMDGVLYVEGLEGDRKCCISVYTVGGVLVLSAETAENTYSTPVMGSGKYILTVKGEKIAGSRVVIVK